MMHPALGSEARSRLLATAGGWTHRYARTRLASEHRAGTNARALRGIDPVRTWITLFPLSPGTVQELARMSVVDSLRAL
jgi:hypothetical protein